MSRIEVNKTYKLYIGGKFTRTESGRYYPVYSKKGELLANMCHASNATAGKHKPNAVSLLFLHSHLIVFSPLFSLFFPAF